MDHINEFVDERQKSWCVHCGGWISTLETNRDHVPSKCLLLKPYPNELPVMQVCKSCNEMFSLDEEYMTTFLSCVLAGSTNPEEQQNPNVGRKLKSNIKLRSRIECAKTKYKTLDGKTKIVWKPEVERINRVTLKNARGHAFYEYGEPMLAEPDHVWSAPIELMTAEERIDFDSINSGGLWPEVGSRMMTRVITGQDTSDDWIIIQDNIYRYGVAQVGGMLVRSVLFEYLATEVYWDL